MRVTSGIEGPEPRDLTVLECWKSSRVRLVRSYEACGIVCEDRPSHGFRKLRSTWWQTRGFLSAEDDGQRLMYRFLLDSPAYVPPSYTLPEIPSINGISAINNHRAALHKTRLATGQEQDAIGDLLRRAGPLHRSDVDEVLAFVDFRAGHGGVDVAGRRSQSVRDKGLSGGA